jgi:hypothetical protein
MNKSYIYYLMQFDETGDLIMSSKTGYTDINRAQAICNRLNREHDFFAKWKEGMQAYVDSNATIIAYKKEISDYENQIYALYSKQDNKSQQLCRKLDGLVAKCNSDMRKLQLILEKEWKEKTNFSIYNIDNNYYQYSLHKIKVK